MYNNKKNALLLCWTSLLKQMQWQDMIMQWQVKVILKENWPNWVKKLREVKGEMCNGLADQWFSKHVAPPQNNTIGWVTVAILV